MTTDGRQSQVLDYIRIQQAIQEKQSAAEAAAMFSAIVGGVGAGLYASSPKANPALSSALTQTVLASVQASSVSVSNSKEEAQVLSGESPKAFLTNVMIPPGRQVSGLVILPPIDNGTAEIRVTVGDETHAFPIVRQ